MNKNDLVALTLTIINDFQNCSGEEFGYSIPDEELNLDNGSKEYKKKGIIIEISATDKQSKSKPNDNKQNIYALYLITENKVERIILDPSTPTASSEKKGFNVSFTQDQLEKLANFLSGYVKWERETYPNNLS